VSGGLFLSARSKEILNHKARLQSTGVWHTLAFILNGLIFILIGLQLPSIVNGLKYYTFQDGIRYGLIVSLLIVVIRLVWLFATTYIPILLIKKLRESPLRPNWKEVFLVGWAGMRGVISLASALAIPVTLANGNEFPERDLVLFISFMVILVTLVFQGLSLPWVIKKLKLEEDKREIPAVIQAQQIHHLLLKLSVDRLEEKYANLLRTNILVKNLKLRFEGEGKVAAVNIKSLEEHSNETALVEEYNHVALDIGEFLNEQLTSWRLDEKFDEDVIRHEESRIDLEQNKIV
jgi:NhaP-type Na+/H+ or K+/H+ antiporter